MNHSLKFLTLFILSVSIATSAGDQTSWPCFHGPRRDNLSAETGLMQAWPEEGLKSLWMASGIGHGYSSVTIAGDRIFTAGMINRQTYVTALDMQGKQLWQRLNGQSWQASERQSWAVPYAGCAAGPAHKALPVPRGIMGGLKGT